MSELVGVERVAYNSAIEDGYCTAGVALAVGRTVFEDKAKSRKSVRTLRVDICSAIEDGHCTAGVALAVVADCF